MTATSKALAFIFDMDGTMIDNMPFHNQVWMNFLAEKGAQPNPATFHDQTAGKTNPEILRLFLGDAITEPTIQAYSLEKETRYRSIYSEHIQPIAGLVKFLDAARQMGIQLGLATSAGPENVAFVLNRLGLSQYFTAVVNGEEIVLGKPDPEIFLEAAKRLGVSPEACLVFEDSRKGIEAAQRAGMPVVVITTGMTEGEAARLCGVRLAAADYTTLSPQSVAQPADAMHWVPVGKGRLSISHRPKRIQIPALAQDGCQRVVSLLSEKEGALRIGHIVRNTGMEWTWLAVANGKYPEGEAHEILLAGVITLAEKLDQGESIFIHCSAGIHRTGMLTYALLRWQGYTEEDALNLIEQLRIQTRDGIMQRQISWGNDIIRLRSEP